MGGCTFGYYGGKCGGIVFEIYFFEVADKCEGVYS